MLAAKVQPKIYFFLIGNLVFILVDLVLYIFGQPSSGFVL